MDSQLTAIVFAVITLVTWGFENALSKKCSQGISPSKMITHRNLVTVFITSIAFIIFFNQAVFNFKYIVFGIFVSALGYVGYVLLLKAFKYGKLGVISPISSSRILITTFVGVVFIKDALNPSQIVFVLMIFMGVVLCSVNFKDFKGSDTFKLKSGVPFALANALLWGIVFPYYSVPSMFLGAFFFSLLLESTGLVLSFVATRAVKGSFLFTKQEFKERGPLMLLLGLFGGIGVVSVNLGYATGHVSIVSAISSALPLITVLYGYIVYKEKLQAKQYLGVILMTLGIICLGYFRG